MKTLEDRESNAPAILRRSSLALGLLAALVGGAAADSATEAAVSLDASLEKVGEARLRVMLWSIYDSRLYTPSGDYREGSRPLRLEIEYLRDIKAGALVDRTKEEWQAMGRNHPEQDAWLARLRELWPDIAENDVLAIEVAGDGAATFTHNGRVLGSIDDPDFGQQFVDIWLSEETTRPSLRASLIGRTATD